MWFCEELNEYYNIESFVIVRLNIARLDKERNFIVISINWREFNSPKRRRKNPLRGNWILNHYRK